MSGPHSTSEHGQQGPTASRPQFESVQALRAVAALLVVVHHVTLMLQERAIFPVTNWVNGGAGADIFFVISGFVMTLSSAPLRASAHPARTFLARRLERVVPLYWIATTLKLGLALAAPALIINAVGSVWRVVGSYLFFFTEYANGGAVEPVLVVGWTLNFEMFFYLLFALALAARWRIVRVMAPLLLVIGFGGYFLQGHHAPAATLYAKAYLLEFLLGMLVAQFLPAIAKGSRALGLALASGGFLTLLLWVWPNFSYFRGVFWGLPACAVVAGSLMMEARKTLRVPWILLRLGDASYSIYLAHGFVLPLFGVVLARLHLSAAWALPAIALLTIAATLGGLVVYQFVELPLIRFFKGRRKSAIPVTV